MADHQGRDIEGDILRVLARQGLPIRVSAIRWALPSPIPSAATVRQHLHLLACSAGPLVLRVTTTTWQITEEGRLMARGQRTPEP